MRALDEINEDNQRLDTVVTKDLQKMTKFGVCIEIFKYLWYN